MWCLGNEVSHRNDPAIVRQLAKQSALTRRIDRQKRPLCAFAANGNVDSYGRSYIDTDVVDLHLYTGITDAWTRWDRALLQPMRRYFRRREAQYQTDHHFRMYRRRLGNAAGSVIQAWRRGPIS